MLVGLIQPSSGEARLLGERVRPSLPALGRVGSLIEGAAFVPYLRGITNLRLWWESSGAKWADADVEDAAVAGLGNAVERKVKTYSHGMKQRLGIARALLGRPDVLILDEPTTGLDPQEIREVRRLIAGLAERGVTILLVEPPARRGGADLQPPRRHGPRPPRRRRLGGADGRRERALGLRGGRLHRRCVLRARGLTGVTGIHPEASGLAIEIDGLPRTRAGGRARARGDRREDGDGTASARGRGPDLVGEEHTR